MNHQNEFVFERSDVDADLLISLLKRSDRILIKKLSNNDRNWAKAKEDYQGQILAGKRKNNQAGVYIPHEQRDSGFFLPLTIKARKGEGEEIREVFFSTLWPQIDGEQRQSRLVHYTSKGQETHFTRIPKPAFAQLSPASFLIMGRIGMEEKLFYECLTIDSCSDEAVLLAEIFGLPPDFMIDIFEPAIIQAESREKILDFADQVIAAWLAGTIDDFAKSHATMPTTIELARQAQQVFLAKSSLTKIDPFALKDPGDVLREISRGIEWELFREYQRRERSVDLVRLALGDSPRPFNAKDLIRILIDEFWRIDALLLSASQQRKSRAGYSYEHHIERLLIDGSVPYEKQVIIEAKKRPDFILPSLAFVDSAREDSDTGLILSAKTTLRERWKQVEREKGSRRLFLTTVDENIAGNAIEDMASLGINLIIPESLKKSKETEYGGHRNVLGFREFCDRHIKPYLTTWI